MTTEAWDTTTAEQLRERGSMKWTRADSGTIAAWVAEMDFGAAQAVLDAWQESARRFEFGYPPTSVTADMAEATAAFYAEQFGWEIPVGDIAPIADVIKGLELSISDFSEPGSAVIVPIPAYMPFLSVPPSMGREVREVPMIKGEDFSYRLDIGAIDRELATGAGLVILANPGNPTGRAFTAEELRELADVVDARGARVFSDEIHAPLVLFGGKHVPFASVSEAAARVAITATSASKAWNLPGLKCAQLILTADADRERWTEIGFMASHGASTPGIRANTAAYRGGLSWLEEVRGYIERNFRRLESRLARDLPKARLTPLQATYLTWIDLADYAVGDDPGGTLLDKARVLVNSGPAFGRAGEGHIRLNIATPLPVLDEALDRIVAALTE